MDAVVRTSSAGLQTYHVEAHVQKYRGSRACIFVRDDVAEWAKVSASQTRGLCSPGFETRMWETFVFHKNNYKKPDAGTEPQRVYDVCIQLQLSVRCSV